MKSKTRSFRKLRSESLESRQLLHGGALVGEPPSAPDIAESVFTRLNTNDDTVLTADDGIAGRVLERLADADTDGNGISQAELTSHIETRIAERSARHAERFDAAFERLDKNDDGSVTADEVSNRRWERISEAAGNDDAVTQDELSEHLEVKRAERQAGNGDTRAEARAARQEAREARQEARAARREARREARAEAAQAETPIDSRMSNVIQRVRSLGRFRR